MRVLLAKGLVVGFPAGTFGGDRPLTRYEMAVVIRRLLDSLPATGKPEAPTASTAPPSVWTATETAKFTDADKALLGRLAAEFLPELAVIGVDIKGLRAKLDLVDRTLADLAKQVADLRNASDSQQREIDASKRLRFSGYFQFRFDALFAHESMFRGAGSGGTGQRPNLGAPRIGGPSNGFLVRRGRFRADGWANSKDSFAFQLDIPSIAPVNLRDAFAEVRSGLPRDVMVKVGQFPPPFSYVLAFTSRVREAPDRPLGYSDTSNSAFIHKDTVSALGGEFTPGSIVPLFVNQDRDTGITFNIRGIRSQTSFGWFNGEGRDVSGQRPLNSATTFIGRFEQRFPVANGNLFAGLSRYDGAYSVRSAAPTGGVPAAFRYADRRFTNVDVRWEGTDGWQVRWEHLGGRFETTPDRALYLPGNTVEAWYTTLRKDVSHSTALSVTWDVFRPVGQVLAGISPDDYARRTLQGGVLHWLGPRTRLRLWYVQALSAYDPSAPVGSRARGKVGQFLGEIQVEY